MDVVITGASTGIGRAVALHLDREGWRVFAGVRRPRDGESLVRAAASERLVPVMIDVTDADGIARARDTVRDAIGPGGRLHGLVNNAGIGVGGPVEFVALDEWRRQLEVNVIGQVAVTQAFLPLMRAGKGRIVNIGSIGGLVASPFLAPYCASKFAMEAITDSMRMELRKWGMWVAIIEPGSIDTPIWPKADTQYADALAALGPDGSQLYGRDVQAFSRAFQKVAARALPPQAVADAALHALTAKRPKPRYVIGRDTKVRLALSRILPERIMDALTSQVLRIGR
jgi:NAD(P)-dependent dehydrogenase (short-subunit alcohol dehydrogenase family)